MWKENQIGKMILKCALLFMSIIVSLSIDYETQSINLIIKLAATSCLLNMASCLILTKHYNLFSFWISAFTICVIVFYTKLTINEQNGIIQVLNILIFRGLKILVFSGNILNIIGIGYNKLQQLRDWFHRK